MNWGEESEIRTAPPLEAAFERKTQDSKRGDAPSLHCRPPPVAPVPADGRPQASRALCAPTVRPGSPPLRAGVVAAAGPH